MLRNFHSRSKSFACSGQVLREPPSVLSGIFISLNRSLDKPHAVTPRSIVDKQESQWSDTRAYEFLSLTQLRVSQHRSTCQTCVPQRASVSDVLRVPDEADGECAEDITCVYACVYVDMCTAWELL